jgi:hypothetical protein
MPMDSTERRATLAWWCGVVRLSLDGSVGRATPSPGFLHSPYGRLGRSQVRLPNQ